MLARDLELALGDSLDSLWTAAEPYFAKLVRHFRPRHVVELGTGAGKTGALIMQNLGLEGRYTTVNQPYPISGDAVAEALQAWIYDPRLKIILGDSASLEVANQVEGPIDLLFVDSCHTQEHARQEFAWYRYKLAAGALVVMDDLDHNDLVYFWDWLPHEKVRSRSVGFFRFSGVT